MRGLPVAHDADTFAFTISMEKNDPAAKKSKSIIDVDLQSRQLATYGMGVMERLAGAAVLIIGMNGLGVEVAKNIVLANVRKVTLADDCVASWSDMGSHFYLQPDDVGRTNRADACRRSIKDVNTGVEVVCCTEPISEELLAAHDAVCVCDCVCRGAGDQLPFMWDDICRRRGVSFIRCEARGVFGYIFDDFTSPGSGGPGMFSVANEGHAVAHISNSNPAVVTVENCRRISSKTVRFSGIQGMTELNGTCAEIAAQEYVALSASEGRLLVTLEGVDATSMRAYRNGGCMTAAPYDTVYNFQPYRDAWHSNPQSRNNAENWPLVGDLGQTDHHRGRQCEANGIPNKHVTRMLRAAFRTLENYPGRKLRAGDEEAAIALVDDICRTIDVFDPQDFFFDDEFDVATGMDDRAAVVQRMRPFFTTFAMSCAGCLSPVAACVAGIAAQEIIKSVAGMGDPLSQFLFFSFLDVLPQPLPTFADVQPHNTRYDSHVAVLGARFHSELRALKVCRPAAAPAGKPLSRRQVMRCARCAWSVLAPRAASC
jgi:ubiquitin-activating enzyme E1